jgi:hypothetical protein
MGFMASGATCALLLSAASATLAAAQQPQTDSALVRITLAAVFSEMGAELAEVVVATPTDGWRIDLPKTTPVWVSASEKVTRLLNSRTPAANDRRERYMTIQEQLVSDTLRTFQITIGQKWRCSGNNNRWVAADRSFEVRLATRDHIWQRVASNAPLVYGDPGICEP